MMQAIRTSFEFCKQVKEDVCVPEEKKTDFRLQKNSSYNCCPLSVHASRYASYLARNSLASAVIWLPPPPFPPVVRTVSGNPSVASAERIIRSAFVYAIFMDRAAERSEPGFIDGMKKLTRTFAKETMVFVVAEVGTDGWFHSFCQILLIFSGKRGLVVF